jgi:hypothetical protein
VRDPLELDGTDRDDQADRRGDPSLERKADRGVLDVDPGRRLQVYPVGWSRLAITTDKFCCPTCGTWKSKVVDSRPDTEGTKYVRWRHCEKCHQMFETAEQVTGKLIPLHPELPAAPSGGTS